MGLFDFTKKNDNVNTVSLIKDPELSKKISLRKDLVVNEVKKNNITATTARVVFVLDHSGSMRTMYKDGTVQDVLERIFPLAMCFDDNAELEFYWFDSTYKELTPVTNSNIEGYVNKVIMSKNDHFGATCYAPVMKKILSRYAKRKRMNIPTFVIFITDGNNSDKRDTKEILIEASKYNIFWKFVGIGNEKFEFLERLDDLKGRFIDNANFISINDIMAIKDDDLYERLLTEYNDWLNLCRQNGISVE